MPTKKRRVFICGNERVGKTMVLFRIVFGENPREEDDSSSFNFEVFRSRGTLLKPAHEVQCWEGGGTIMVSMDRISLTRSAKKAMVYLL